MTVKWYLQKAVSLPPRVAIRKGVRLAKWKLELLRRRKQDVKHSTYAKPILSPTRELYSYFQTVPIDLLGSHAKQIEAVAAHYLAHRFDLLGSGWVEVKHGMNCRGLEGYFYRMGSVVQADSEGHWLQSRISPSNVKESQRIWRLVDQGYTPIDWQLDFKSGYRWFEATWYLDVRYGHKLGVDIKVPRELARMQHLPQLGLAHAIARRKAEGVRCKVLGEKTQSCMAGGKSWPTLDQTQTVFVTPEVYAQEFSNQVLDFIANNPPRFGVNWQCSMDVGIRVANWLVAYDLFKAFGAEFDPDFEKVFIRSVYDHGLHIVNNLEWSEELTSNHYLADIVGLLFVAAYLERSSEVDVWLAFAVQELIKEVSKQFYEDGANFEASTSYHRLSAEMVVYATALVLGLPENKQTVLQRYDHRLHKVRPRLATGPIPMYSLTVNKRLTAFPYWYIRRLEKMAEFTMHITKPHGHISQIGDNDNGRFLKLQPVYHKMTVADAKTRYINLDGYSDLSDDAIYWDEDHLDHRYLVAEINGLFEREDFERFSGGHGLETCLVKVLAGNIRFPSYHRSDEQTAAELVRVGTKEDLKRLNGKLNTLPEESRNTWEVPVTGEDLREGLKLYAYPDFGLYLYRSRRLYLAVRCGPIGQNGNGGHAHNDQLSLELSIDGRDWISDSGTYLYTPLPTRRNEYRSVIAHFAPQLSDREPDNLDYSLFRLADEAKAACLYFGKKGFIGTHHGHGQPVYRIVRLFENALHIIDYTEGNTPLRDIYRIDSDQPTVIPRSLGYGLRNA